MLRIPTIRALLGLAFVAAAALFAAREFHRRPVARTNLPRLAAEMHVDLNAASAGELSALPGIGQKTAETIVADRAARGPFESPADLCRVKGIGPAKFKRVEQWVEVGGSALADHDRPEKQDAFVGE